MHSSQRRRLHLGRIGRGIILRFVLFALLSVLLILAMVAYTTWRQYNDIQALQSKAAQWIGTSIDNWLREIDYSLVPLSEPALVTMPADAAQSRLEATLSQNANLLSVTLIDARSGREIASAGRQTTTVADPEGQGCFLNDQGSFVSPVDFSHLVPIVTVARYILQDGQRVGVLAAQADLSWANKLLTEVSTRDGSYYYIVDNAGHPLLHLGTHFVYPQRARTDIAGIQAAISGQAMPTYYQGLNTAGEAVVGTYRHLEQAPWFVIAEEPLRSVGQRLLPLGLGTLGILLLFALAAAVVGVYISRRVAMPIAQLQEGARRIGSGEMDYRLEVHGRGELAELAAEFNRMAENVQASRADLERWSHELETRIQERTQELTLALAQQRQEALVRENLLRTIREMSSPVIPILEGILVMPIVGTLDSERAQRVVADLLAGIEREHARAIIIDITGLAVVDTAVANALLQAAQAARILGAEPILVGISAAVAETLVQLGVEMRLRTAATLQEGLKFALSLQRRQVVSA